jgi:hypothetical protein
MTTRLASCMNSLITFTQIIYIKGKNIMDNVVVASEVLQQVRVKKIKSVLFKIDFEQTFDRVH